MMINDFKKPLFTLLTIGILATACAGGDLLEEAKPVIEIATPIVSSGEKPTDPTATAQTEPAVEVADKDGDGFEEGADCDDDNAAVNPDVVENTFSRNSGRFADGLDNNCNNEIDEKTCDCNDFKGFALPRDDKQAEFSDDAESNTLSDDAQEPKAGAHKRKHPINLMCMKYLAKFQAQSNWDCAKVPEDTERGPGDGKKHGKKPGKGGKAEHNNGHDTESSDDADTTTTEDAAETSIRTPASDTPATPASDTPATPASDTPATPASVADTSYIESLKFWVHTLDKSSASLSKANWEQLYAEVNFNNGEAVVEIVCNFKKVGIAYPNDLNNLSGAEFSFKLNILENLDECSGTEITDKDYKTFAKVSNIKDIRLSSDANSGVDLGIKGIEITANLSDGTSLKFYDNNNVYSYVLDGGVNNEDSHPLQDKKCAGLAVHGGYVYFPNASRSGGTNGNNTPELAAAWNIIFAPGDKEVHIKAKAKSGSTHDGTTNLISWNFGSESKDECNIELFKQIADGEEVNAYFYVPKALTNEQVADGGFFKKKGADSATFNDGMSVAYVYSTVTDCWNNDGWSDNDRPEWKGWKKDFMLDENKFAMEIPVRSTKNQPSTTGGTR
jgi:hypothetical protein